MWLLLCVGSAELIIIHNQVYFYFLTGHVALNYHLNKYKPDKVSKTYLHCLAAEETTNHYIGQCPKWFAQRIAVPRFSTVSIAKGVGVLRIIQKKSS